MYELFQLQKLVHPGLETLKLWISRSMLNLIFLLVPRLILSLVGSAQNIDIQKEQA